MSDAEKRLREWLTKYQQRGTLTDEARGHLDALMAEHSVALSRARSEALEEVRARLEAVRSRGEPTTQAGLADALWHVKQLGATPAPATIPVERVRESLAKAARVLERQGYGAGIIRDISKDLGVDLDAKGEASAPDIVRQAQGSYPLPVSLRFVNLRCRHCSSILFIVNDVGDERCSGCGRDWAPVSP